MGDCPTPPGRMGTEGGGGHLLSSGPSGPFPLLHSARLESVPHLHTPPTPPKLVLAAPKSNYWESQAPWAVPILQEGNRHCSASGAGSQLANARARGGPSLLLPG